MRMIANRLGEFLRDEEGATTAEYGIIVVIIAAIAIAVLTQLNTSLTKLYEGADANIEKAVNTPPAGGTTP
jgi:Flp pilus assembly pilin Flp